MSKEENQKIEEASKDAKKPLSIKDILLDKNNPEPIVLADATGKKLAFEQIAVIPHNEKIYAILKPIEHIDNVADDEAIVFYVQEENGKEPVLVVEADEKTAFEVFDKYYKLFDNIEKQNKKKAKKKPKSTK